MVTFILVLPEAGIALNLSTPYLALNCKGSLPVIEIGLNEIFVQTSADQFATKKFLSTFTGRNAFVRYLIIGGRYEKQERNI
ncbi:MAG: hypothetical protein K6T91_02635 [Firmicutes bacterium]|nr:hypothetical protein [Bacillota bacterium]